MNFDTKAIHSGTHHDPKTGASCLPIYNTASFTHEDPKDLEDIFAGRKFGHVYSRISNPTVTAFEQKMTALESGLGSIAFGSGMAAIHAAIMTLVQAGDEIIASSSLFGGTYYLLEDLKRLGIAVYYADPLHTEQFTSLITDKTRLIFMECIGNPKVDVPHIADIAKVAAQHHVPVIVDATLATPYLFSGKAHGANIVVHSATKYIGLGGATMGGVLTDLGNFDWKNTQSDMVKTMVPKAGTYAFLAKCRKMMLTNAGSSLAPFNAYLLHQGLETMSLRMDRHCDNALALAEFFAQHEGIANVNYPGLNSSPFYHIAAAQYHNRFGALLTIRLGTKDRCYNVIRALKIAKNQANLGDSKTLVIHPESTIYRDCTTDQQLASGVYPDLIRISVGLEHIADLKEDFNHALIG